MAHEAIIIVDHGSRRPEANEMLEELAALLRTMTTRPVFAAHMEIASPSIAEAFGQAVEGGAEFVLVFPYFLSPGAHSREDIPRLADQAAKQYGVRYHCAGPIGLDPLMAVLILHRLHLCREHDYQCDRCPRRPECKRPG